MSKYYPGYCEVRREVLKQPLTDDIRLIDALFGRDGLRYGATEEEVKREALRQLEIEWRMPEERL